VRLTEIVCSLLAVIPGSRITACFGAIADDLYLYLSPLTNYISKAKQVECDQLHPTMLSQRMWSRGKYPLTKPAFLTHFIEVGLRLGTVSQTASKRLLYPAPATAAVRYAKYIPVCCVQPKFSFLSSSQSNPASIDPSQPNR
jgi:hypothetical protein